MPLLFFSLLPLPVLAVIAIAMYRRKQHRVYLVFWAYLILHFIRISVQQIAYRISYASYIYAYWTGCVVGAIVTLLLLRTIFVTVLEGYSPLTRLRRLGYDIVLLAVWALALFLTFHDSNSRTLRQLIFGASGELYGRCDVRVRRWIFRAIGDSMDFSDLRYCAGCWVDGNCRSGCLRRALPRSFVLNQRCQLDRNAYAQLHGRHLCLLLCAKAGRSSNPGIDQARVAAVG